jgi:hypothetical protein
VLGVLNQVILEEVIAELHGNLDEKIAGLSRSTHQLEERAGRAVSQRVLLATVEVRRAIRRI